MNLFYLDEDLDKCAEYHVDKHIVKMPLEVAQIMCTTIWIDVHLGFIPRALNKEERDTLNALRSTLQYIYCEKHGLDTLPYLHQHIRPQTYPQRLQVAKKYHHPLVEYPIGRYIRHFVYSSYMIARLNYALYNSIIIFFTKS